jgi:thiopeptide-type bacteriocin biosynthesis protein
MNNWKSYHIFIRDSKQQEDLIIKINDYFQIRLEEKSVQKWFYIRYWEGGPHIRVRYVRNNQIVDEQFQEFIQSELVSYPSIKLSKEDFYAGIDVKLEGFEQELADFPWYAEKTIKEIAYLPELERYGGSENIQLSEELFFFSSLMAAKLISITRNSLQTRLLMIMYILNYLMLNLNIEGKYQINWLEFLEYCYDFWEATGYSKTELNPHLIVSKLVSNNLKFKQLIELAGIEEYLISFKKMLLQLQANDLSISSFLSILFSQFHMTFNRLGLEPRSEQFTYKALEGVIINERI